MKLHTFFFSFVAILIGTSSLAQKAYLADPENFDPAGEITIMVDISKCDCQRLLDHPGPVFLWTWNPAELPASDPNANGSWTASNPNLEMTNEGGNIWSFTMVPTEFYQVEAAKVYENDFSFLVKASDGTGGGGGGCDEDKTEDLSITVDPPVTPAQVISGFPSVAMADDVFTVAYDNSLDDKESMQDLAADEVFLYAAVVADSVEYRIANFFQVAEHPKLQMKQNKAGVFYLSFIPNEFFAEVIPEGAIIQSMEFAVRKRVYASPGDKSDAELIFAVGCPAVE